MGDESGQKTPPKSKRRKGGLHGRIGDGQGVTKTALDSHLTAKIRIAFDLAGPFYFSRLVSGLKWAGFGIVCIGWVLFIPGYHPPVNSYTSIRLLSS